MHKKIWFLKLFFIYFISFSTYSEEIPDLVGNKKIKWYSKYKNGSTTEIGSIQMRDCNYNETRIRLMHDDGPLVETNTPPIELWFSKPTDRDYTAFKKDMINVSRALILFIAYADQVQDPVLANEITILERLQTYPIRCTPEDGEPEIPLNQQFKDAINNINAWKNDITLNDRTDITNIVTRQTGNRFTPATYDLWDAFKIGPFNPDDNEKYNFQIYLEDVNSPPLDGDIIEGVKYGLSVEDPINSNITTHFGYHSSRGVAGSERNVLDLSEPAFKPALNRLMHRINCLRGNTQMRPGEKNRRLMSFISKDDKLLNALGNNHSICDSTCCFRGRCWQEQNDNLADTLEPCVPFPSEYECLYE